MATDSICPKCGGTGWIIIERANISGAEPCDCRFQGRAARLEERAQIPPQYAGARLDTFDLTYHDPHLATDLKKVFFVAKNYAENFIRDDPRPGLLLLGDPGTGKTHLAVAVLRAIIERGFEGLFCDYQTLLNSIKAGYDPASNSSDKEAYRSALDAEVLLLDDLGAHRVTDWVEDTVTSIVTYRCNNRKPLIATTNLPDGEAGSSIMQKTPVGVEYRVTLVDRIGARARSRLFEMCTVVRMPTVNDYRLRKARKF